MADNTFVNIGGHKVSAGIKYSTSEVRTGDVWIDGKPIYKVVVSHLVDSPYDTTGNERSFYMYYQDTTFHIDQLINIHGTATGIDGSLTGISYFIPQAYANTALTSLALGTDIHTDTNGLTVCVNINKSTNCTKMQFDFVMEYTKSTD